MKFCECGCGQIVKPGKRFICGHNLKCADMREKLSQRMKDGNPMKRPDVAKKKC